MSSKQLCLVEVANAQRGGENLRTDLWLPTNQASLLTCAFQQENRVLDFPALSSSSPTPEANLRSTSEVKAEPKGEEEEVEGGQRVSKREIQNQGTGSLDFPNL